MTDFETMKKFMSQVQFTYKKGWYREADVDTFIDTLLGMVDELKKNAAATEEENAALHGKNDTLEKENASLRDKTVQLESQLQAQAAPVEKQTDSGEYEQLKAELAEMKQKESAIAAVMVQAEQTASQTIARGKAEADRLIAEAKGTCSSYAAEAAAAREAAIRSCDDVRAQLALLNREKNDFIAQILGQMDHFTERLHALEQVTPAAEPQTSPASAAAGQNVPSDTAQSVPQQASDSIFRSDFAEP